MAAAKRTRIISEELRSRILGRRLAAHSLTRKLAPGSLLEAAAACSVQNTPHGSAELSLMARVEGLRPGEVARALEDRTLVQAWSLRAAPHVFPAVEYRTYTTGLMPWDDESTLFFITGASDHLAQADITAGRLIELMTPVIGEVLDGRGLVKDELGKEVANRLAPTLPPEARSMWNEAGRFGRFGETLVRYGPYVSALNGSVSTAL